MAKAKTAAIRDDSQVVFEIADDNADEVVRLWRQWLNARAAGNDEAVAHLDAEIRNATPTTFDGALCQIRMIQAREATGPVNSSGDLATALGHLSRLGGGEARASVIIGHPDDCPAVKAKVVEEAARKAYNQATTEDPESPEWLASEAATDALRTTRATSIQGVLAQLDEIAIPDDFNSDSGQRACLENIRASLRAFAMIPPSEEDPEAHFSRLVEEMVQLQKRMPPREPAPRAPVQPKPSPDEMFAETAQSILEGWELKGGLAHDDMINVLCAAEARLVQLPATEPANLLRKLDIATGHTDEGAAQTLAEFAADPSTHDGGEFALLMLRRDLKAMIAANT